jgi:FkbM family methyltransferase
LNAVYGSVNTTDQGTPDQITSPHLFGWWPEAIWDHLVGVGFTDIQFMNEKIPHPESNFRVEATKPMASSLTPDRTKYLEQEPITYNEIFVDNEYNLSREEIEGTVVIDVGANLGFFSIMCKDLGAKTVFAIEAQPTVYKLGLLENVRKFTNIIPINAAVLDVDGATVLIPNNHVASVISKEHGEPVSTVTLKTLLKDIQGDDLVLKLDCEGSEFEIILSADYETIKRFKTINMELHANTNENPKYHDVNLIRQRLTVFGFTCNNVGNALRDNCAIEKWVRR